METARDVAEDTRSESEEAFEIFSDEEMHFELPSSTTSLSERMGAPLVFETLKNSALYPEDRVSTAVQEALDFLNKESLCISNPEALARYLDTSFIDSLLTQKCILKSKNARAMSASTNWIDTVIVSLSHVVMSLCSAARSPILQPQHPTSLLRGAKHEQELRASTQLPDNWDSLPSLIVAENVTPLCRRLAITLLFGACIIKPSLENSGSLCWDLFPHYSAEDPPVSHCTNYQTLLARLRSLIPVYASQRVDSERGAISSHEDFDLQPLEYVLEAERIEYAMMLGIFSQQAAEMIDTPPSEMQNRYRPHTLSNILLLLLTVVRPSERSTEVVGPTDVSFLKDLDTAQYTLFHWSDFPVWAWSIWGVGSTSFPTITFLVASWLYHKSTVTRLPPPMELSCPFLDDIDTTELTSLVTNEVFVSRFTCDALVSVLEAFGAVYFEDYTVDPESLQPIQKVVYLATWCCLRLNQHAKTRSLSSLHAFLGAVSDILSRIILSRSGSLAPNPRVQLCIISFLSEAVMKTPVGQQLFRVDPDDTVECLIRVAKKCQNSSSSIPQNATRSGNQGLNSKSNDHSDFNSLHLLNTTLGLIALQLPGDTKLASRIYSSNALALIVDVASRWPMQAAHLQPYNVISNLVLVLALLVDAYEGASRKITKICDFHLIHRIVMDQGPGDLVLATSAANLFTSLPPLAWTTLELLERWNYLRDALLLIVNGYFATSGLGVLALLSAPALCNALKHMLCQLDLHSLQHVLNSPWTSSLVAELTNLQVVNNVEGPELQAREQFHAQATDLNSSIQECRRRLSQVRTHPIVRDSPPNPDRKLKVSFVFCRLPPHNAMRLVALYPFEL